VAMLADGLIKHHEKSCLRSSSAQSYLFISFWLDNGSLQALITLSEPQNLQINMSFLSGIKKEN
jgi:hypothetical protein